MSKELTPAENRVIALLARGLPNKLIAHELGITVSTVERHVEKIFLKTGATNRVQAALERHGLPWRKAEH